MDLKIYIRPLLKWWWLILAATLIAAISSFLVTRRQPPIYQSRTTLVVGSAVYESNPSGGDFFLNQQLSSFYADIGKREVVRNATMDKLGIAWLPEYNVSPVPNSQFLEIVVTDAIPERAQAVANELANQLILQTPTGNQEDQERQTFVEEQLNQLEAKIIETQDEIADKQAQLADMFSAREIADVQNDIAALERKHSDLQANFSTLLTSSNRGAINTLSVMETASLPRRPIGPNTQMVVLLSSAIAFFISVMAAYLLEYLDDTLKSPEEISQLLDLPIVGYISEIDDTNSKGAYVAKQPRSGVAESFRSLRTDLEFAGVDKPLKTIYVTSADMNAGKTSTAVNLAVIMAQGGKKVILLDADLRKPSVHSTLGISNKKGLSDVFRGSRDLFEVVMHWVDGNIGVITSGDVPPNPSELLSSDKMNQILESLSNKADIVIIDGPPFLITDATILSSKVNGVLLVIRYGRTRKNSALSAVEKLQRSGARILGVVLNRVPHIGGSSYNLYSYYYGDEVEETIDSSNGKPIIARIFRKKPETRADKVDVDKLGGD